MTFANDHNNFEIDSVKEVFDPRLGDVYQVLFERVEQATYCARFTRLQAPQFNGAKKLASAGGLLLTYEGDRDFEDEFFVSFIKS